MNLTKLTRVHAHNRCLRYILLSLNCSYIDIEVRVLVLFQSIVLVLFVASPVVTPGYAMRNRGIRAAIHVKS
jgi:hypothetical protein